MRNPTIRIHTFFGNTVYLDSPRFLTDSFLGALVEGWFRYEDQLWPGDYGAFRLETCESWEIV